MELEQGKNVDFWRDMTTITEDEINKLRKLEASGKGPGKAQPNHILYNGKFAHGSRSNSKCVLVYLFV